MHHANNVVYAEKEALYKEAQRAYTEATAGCGPLRDCLAELQGKITESAQLRRTAKTKLDAAIRKAESATADIEKWVGTEVADGK